MIDRRDMEGCVLQAVAAHGGRATVLEVAKHVWENHKRAIEGSPFLYSWQYDARWAATSLRKQGKLKPAHVSPRGIWELSP